MTAPRSRLLPGALLGADGRPGPRTARDWTVDAVLTALCVVAGFVFLAGSRNDAVHHVSDTAEFVDVLLGAAACVLLWWRRPYPVAVTAFMVVASAFAASPTMAAIVSLVSLAIHRRAIYAFVAGAGFIATSALFAVVRPIHSTMLETLIFTAIVTAALIAWGMALRARRQLVLSLRERAERAEDEQRLQADSARLAERTRIAREMHDVLAHRISLIALHAGGLEMRPDLPPDEVRQTAQLLRSTSRQALEELRDVIGVLRSDEPATARPQPTLSDVPRLVAETRQAGAKVDLQVDVPDTAAVPTGLGRDAYRIVQEALTNAAKHARGTATAVDIAGAPGRGLRVVVRNRLPIAAGSVLPGAGSGLTGLTERVGLSGGTLRHGPDGRGDFVVDADLRWDA